MTPEHKQAIEALRETRDALHNLVRACPVEGLVATDKARAALAHADYVLALQAKEGA